MNFTQANEPGANSVGMNSLGQISMLQVTGESTPSLSMSGIKPVKFHGTEITTIYFFSNCNYCLENG